jgi:hypothetical protein
VSPPRKQTPKHQNQVPALTTTDPLATIAIKAVKGANVTGAIIIPTNDVNTDSDMTRGFISATKSNAFSTTALLPLRSILRFFKLRSLADIIAAPE